jgi:tetratricopeptide (TPR) repeat protein
VAVVGGEHPLARLLGWNVVLPEATEHRLAAPAGDLAAPLLEGLANSVSLSREEKDRIIDSLPKVSTGQIQELVRIFGEEQRKFRELPPNHWPPTADLVGRHWAEWALLSGRRLDVNPEEAVRQLLEGWPRALEGELSTRMALAALDVLRDAGVVPVEAVRAFLNRLVEANPDSDFALGSAAVVLVETIEDVDAARSLFERVAELAPSETSLQLAWLLHQAGNRLLAVRQTDALLLLQQAGRHYERALAIKPDKHEAENKLR